MASSNGQDLERAGPHHEGGDGVGEAQGGATDSVSRRAYLAFVVFALVFVAWIGAWVLKTWLSAHFTIIENEWVSFVYWLFMQAGVWIVPAVWLLRTVGSSVREAFRVPSWKTALVWGSALGGVFLVLSVGSRILSADWSLPFDSVPSLISTVILAPVFEEFLMRGAIMTALRQKWSFAVANGITAVLFLALHCPGWYFLGVLSEQFLHPLGGAVAVLAVGLLCGLAAKRSSALPAAMIVHLLNNIF